MKIRLHLSVLFIVLGGLLSPARSEDCRVLSQFGGLIFDVGAQTGAERMEHHLDRAIKAGVEKIVLYPNPQGEDPEELQFLFPDQVLQGENPWNGIEPINWQTAHADFDLAGLYRILEADPDAPVVLSAPSKLEKHILAEALESFPNLWIGLGPDEIRMMKETCAKGPLGTLLTRSSKRIVFTSLGADQTWRFYPWLVRDLKQVASYLSPELAARILYQNAERLYDLAVNAP